MKRGARDIITFLTETCASFLVIIIIKFYMMMMMMMTRNWHRFLLQDS